MNDDELLINLFLLMVSGGKLSYFMIFFFFFFCVCVCVCVGGGGGG